MKDEPEERKEGIGEAKQPMLILLSIYIHESLHVPAGGLWPGGEAVETGQTGLPVVRRTCSESGEASTCPTALYGCSGN